MHECSTHSTHSTHGHTEVTVLACRMSAPDPTSLPLCALIGWMCCVCRFVWTAGLKTPGSAARSSNISGLAPGSPVLGKHHKERLIWRGAPLHCAANKTPQRLFDCILKPGSISDNTSRSKERITADFSGLNPTVICLIPANRLKVK